MFSKNWFVLVILICFSQTIVAADFEGHWRDDQPCAADGLGTHYVFTLRKASSNTYAGEWEASSNSKGQAGNLRGQVKKSQLILESCIDPESSNWSVTKSEACPHYQSLGKYIRKDNKLISITKMTTPQYTVIEGAVLRKQVEPKGDSVTRLYECRKNEE